MIIRNTTPDDAKALIDYLKIVLDETDNLTMDSSEFSITEEDERKMIQSWIDNRNTNHLLCLVDDEIVGVCGIHGNDKKPRIAHRSSLGITVKKSHWGQGIGRALVEAQIEYAMKNGITKIDLEVRTDNPAAISLYESLGFINAGINKRSMLINDEYIDTYYMGLIVKEG